MLVHVILLLPVYFCYSVCRLLRFVRARRKWVALGTAALWLAFIYGFWKIGENFPILSPKHGIFTIQQVFLYILIKSVFIEEREEFFIEKLN
jgi:hypothetical protein